jgi:ribosomal-protein-alanine N-acetyltransferase
MSEAVSAVVEFAFEELALHRVEAACLPHNDASRSLLLKVGFRQEGYARQYLRINGKWQDHLLFEILRDDPRL